MQHPPPNRNQPITPNYFQQLAFSASLGDESGIYQRTPKRSRITLDRNALISLAVIFLVVLISAVIVGIYNGQTSAKALPTSANSAGKNIATESEKPLSAGVDPANSAGEFAQNSSEKIVVYVSGAVARPGVVEVKANSRINDAIKAAGDALTEADLTRVNLAQLIHDGEQIHIPKVGENLDNSLAPGVQGDYLAGVGGSSADSGSTPAAGETKINLNRATLAQLEQIPGVGPVTAQEILAWREKNGSFKSVEQLLQISGIGEKTLAKIQPYVEL